MAHNIDSQIVGNPETPRVIRMHADDNVAIVANDFGLAAGAQLPSGPALRERVPQGHKVALVDLAETRTLDERPKDRRSQERLQK
jgi:hypothetical protein